MSALLAVSFFAFDFVTDFGELDSAQTVLTADASERPVAEPDLSQVELAAPNASETEVTVTAPPAADQTFSRWAAIVDLDRIPGAEAEGQLEAGADSLELTADAESASETAAAPEPEPTTPPATDPPAPATTPASPPPTTAAPPPPEPPSVTGLSASDLHALRMCESGGNYGAYNSAGPYMGAYQFSQGAWNGTANYLGRADLVGVAPHEASPAVQDAMAVGLWRSAGPGQWPHCGAHLPPKP